jgi:hypothetical protein
VGRFARGWHRLSTTDPPPYDYKSSQILSQIYMKKALIQLLDALLIYFLHVL